MQFNEKLKELRLKKGISQAELAKSIFVSRSAVAKWENGLGLPNEESLNLLAEFFTLSKEELCSDKAIETVIVNKNVTISKSRKLLLIISAVGLAVIIALILALVFVQNRHKSERFTIDGAEYQYTSQLPLLNGKLAEMLNIKSENIYIKNGGEIRTNKTGTISFLLIDAFIADTSELYSVQIQYQNESDYIVIKEQVDDVGGERVPLESAFNAISLWNNESNYQTARFIISADMVINPYPYDNIGQWLYDENKLTEVSTPQTGLYSRIMVLTDNLTHNELYIKIKD